MTNENGRIHGWVWALFKFSNINSAYINRYSYLPGDVLIEDREEYIYP
jgi:hypothetical protein